MKTKVITLISLLLSAAIFFSCSKESEKVNPEPQPTPTPTPVPKPTPETKKADYTVMIYGCAGGDLDADAVRMIRNCLEYGSTESVKIAVEFNFSKKYQSTKPLPGTLRIAVPDSSTTYKDDDGFTSMTQFLSFIDSLSLAEVLVKDNQPLLLADKPAMLDFINWASAKYPARNYILVLWNHGTGWNVIDDSSSTKAVIIDDNNPGVPLDLGLLLQTVRESSVKKFKCIYNDACLMCNLENYSGYRTIADYAIGSTSPASSVGGDYNMLLTLLNGLSVKKDGEFQKIMRKYCDYTITKWTMGTSAFDISITDLTRLDTVEFQVKRYIDTLVKVYPSDSAAINRGIRSALAVLRTGSRYEPLIEIRNLCDRISDATSDPRLMYLNNDVSGAISTIKYTAATPSLSSRLNISTIGFGFSVYFADSKQFAIDKEVYVTTDFDKAVGWSRFMEMNGQSFCQNPSMVVR